MTLIQDLDKILHDPNVWFIPGFIVVILLELYYTHKHHMDDVYDDPKDTFANLNMGMGSLVIGIFTKAVWFIIFTLLNKFAIFDFRPDQWYAWVILLFADDITFYWFHRAAHEIRILWADHSNHHSSQKYNFAVALRQPWLGQFYAYIFWAWLAILGFPAIMIMTMKAISLLYQFFVHTRTVKKLGFLELFMNTPSHHRVHHAVNTRYLDRNHGGIFIIWDKMFGTFEEEKEEPEFGLTVNLDTYNPVKIALNEYIGLWQDVKRAPDFKTKLKYIFMPPGWTHNGELKTSNELRKKLNIK
jgi:sterol desaturase/sphingolipid hydroxylase (fatty acid hydroxylase superfamily)